MKRKLETALSVNDTVLLDKVKEEQETLNLIKKEAADQFKKICKKLIIKIYEESRWDESKYDELIEKGFRGDSLLKALGISHEVQNEHKNPKLYKKNKTNAPKNKSKEEF